jgi:hypothetical protein
MWARSGSMRWASAAWRLYQRLAITGRSDGERSVVGVTTTGRHQSLYRFRTEMGQTVVGVERLLKRARTTKSAAVAALDRRQHLIQFSTALVTLFSFLFSCSDPPPQRAYTSFSTCKFPSEPLFVRRIFFSIFIIPRSTPLAALNARRPP